MDKFFLTALEQKLLSEQEADQACYYEQTFFDPEDKTVKTVERLVGMTTGGPGLKKPEGAITRITKDASSENVDVRLELAPNGGGKVPMEEVMPRRSQNFDQGDLSPVNDIGRV
jgi:hypothetical protein